MKNRYQCPHLFALAEGCYNGASNAYALIGVLSDSGRKELSPGELKDHPAVLYILGHINFLCGDPSTPSMAVHDAYTDWREAPQESTDHAST